ncbi:Zinc finger BED domain-containing protein DAYSLEEPER [Quillaja saponaria]|uniref:Zinc finger BED domain-containing protein DAYSLEEPER n=1 Tax=Quillaja saponaria TaxID=32244 RepID=A0AAD7LE97_QUISA|nr:Zinc finger BED domain-containing protein DAYSLEEPER [Quillaja saponaria]KAJ7956571.1 Zinc finger BED domain-containing protein DAYSLEEPER [Quillaja saponaria]
MEWSVNNPHKYFKGRAWLLWLKFLCIYLNSEDIEPKPVMDMTLISNINPVNIELSSSENGNSNPSVKPRKKTMTSVYLKFFETAVDGKSRTCKFCGQSYSIATATGNLGIHLANRHPGYDKSGNVVTDSVSQPTSVIKKSQPQSRFNQVDFDHLNWLLLKWLVSASLPPSTAEEKWLANSFKFLNPSVQLWSGEKYRSVLNEVFRSMQKDVRASLEQVSSKLSITLDFWTSFEQIFYMSITCQWIDEKWCFQKVLLDIRHIPYPCGGAEIYQTLVKVLKMYNMENRVLSCTHDNSQSAMHACHIFKEHLDSNKLGPFCYIPCAARTLNLIIDDGLRITKAVISKIREFVLELNASAEISEDFVKTSKAYREGSWKFPIDASARWSGNYQMLDIVHKAGKSVDAVVRKYEDILDSRMLLTSAEKNVVGIMHQYLEPFYKTTNNICANKVPTIGLVLFFMDHISETISTCIESNHSPDWLKSAAEDMAKKARSYNNQVCNIFTYMTAILDPRIKGELIPESLNSEKFLDEARTHFMRNYTTSHFPSLSTGYGCGAPETEDGGSVSFAEEIARKKRRPSMNTATDELTQYLSEAPAPIPTDVLEWWKANSTRYPLLSMMARDFLAVQATSAVPEELFCGKGNEINKQRFCIPHDSTQAVLCIKSWMQVGIKLKFESTEIDYDRLMELAASAATDTNATGPDKKQK